MPEINVHTLPAQSQNEGPLPRTQGGARVMNSFAYVQQVSLVLERNF